VLIVQDEEVLCGFSEDDVRRVSKRTLVVAVLRDNLLRRSQPGTNASSQHVRQRRAVDAKTATVSLSPATSDKVALSSPSSPLSDTSPVRGTMKGNIKVKLLLGRRYRLLPTSKEQQRDRSASGKLAKNDLEAVKKGRQRRRSSKSDESDTSSSGESEVKYSLSSVTSSRRGRPSLHPATLVKARARQLVSRACSSVRAERKPSDLTTVTRPWAPCWHGRLQLPTQSSRSSRKITINRRFLDDSYTSIGQPGLAETSPTEQSSVQDSTEHASSSSTGSRGRSVGLLNRSLGSRPVTKPWKRLPSSDKTVASRPRIRQSRSLSRLEVKDNDANATAENRTVDKLTEDIAVAALTDEEAPWVTNKYTSIYSNRAKKGSMLGKHCHICDSQHMVLHHYMCRMPVCRCCARFYKGHCDRGTELGQLTCLQQGELCCRIIEHVLILL